MGEVKAAHSRAGGRKIIWIVALLVLFMTLFLIGYLPRAKALRDAQAEAAAETLPTFVYVLAERGKAANELALPANIKPLQETTLFARTNGYLKRWTVDIGDQVKEGQLLAQIETPELDREIQQVRASQQQVKAHLGLAKVTAERYIALLKEDAVSPQEVDEKKAVLEARMADYAATEANLRRLEQLRAFQQVQAPFAGTITARNVEVGSLIQAGSASGVGWLFKIVQMDRLRIHVAVPQSAIQLIHPGTSAELSVPELGKHIVEAKVERSAGALDPATRTMIVELLAENAERKIIPGMYGQVRFKITGAKSHLVIPVTSLMVGGEGIRVATIDAGDVVHLKKIRLGRDHGKEVEVIEGLNDQERVVSNPRDTLEDGLKVKAVLQEKPAEKKDDKKPGSKGNA
ncbi:MAG: efflux RND transporter periplasmic adaptor subunit [Betaproteobacteria bacterium]|nr:efflux RND transporter periplasmic adaptor subunit [Betaproteobacteria bacterium]